MKKVSKEQYLFDLAKLRELLFKIDFASQEFPTLIALSPSRRLELNEAARNLKREIVYSQTDLWNELLIQDREAVLKTPRRKG